ncbi:MAG: amidohydrolase family protein [Candidatus Competibacterales bacterium]|nr:amidohydrolase family protein [Candidatus Competibacterales bacterium]
MASGAREKVIKAARLIDVETGEVLDDPVIVIDGGTIRSVGTAEQIEIPPGAEVIDAGTATLIPGMIDCHIHTAMFNCLTFHNFRVAQWEVRPELQQMYSLFHAQMCFDMGFTTLRDMGLATSRGLLTAELCAVRDSIDLGLFPGPRLLVAGWSHITGSHLDLIMPRAAIRQPDQTADGPYGLRRQTRENLRIGVDVVKTCASGGGGTDKEEPDIINMTQEELDAIVDEAHKFHKIAAVHCFTPESQRMALRAGVDTIEHMVFTDDDALARIAEAGVYVTPTLSHRTDHAIEVRRELGTPEFVLKKMKAIQPYTFETFQRMHETGINIAMGTDMGFDPEMGSNAAELEIYVDLGMSTLEVLRTTTINAARALKMESRLGSLRAGKEADIVAVAGDPLADIRVLQEKRNIELVMKAGEVCVDRREGRDRSVIVPEPGDWKIVDYL